MGMLATKSGISRSQLYEMLGAVMNPSLRMILKLSRALDVSIEEQREKEGLSSFL